MSRYAIYVVSDSTGETAWRTTGSALLQFPDQRWNVRRFADVRDRKTLEGILDLIAADGATALVVYTFADTRLREYMAARLTEQGIRGIDLIGPVIEQLRDAAGRKPAGVTGAQYRQDAQYGTRMRAIEYAVKHDDGAGLATIGQADVILIGPSRTGKTPLSMLLANHGYRVANLPFIPGQPLIEMLDGADDALVVGLMIDADELVRYREERIRSGKGVPGASRYAEPAVVAEELAQARAFFVERGWLVVDVSGRAIEEIAIEIIGHLDPESTHVGGL
ncbi:MAG: kinase/pyrophosphorylase [Candidatus Dadabacteria bacterium]|nr:MAG: kinase/pyrophosphorylase [Candidatus Dadabacteria bacterium]